MKVCSTCKAKKLKSEFHRKKSNKDGLNNQCKECRAKQGKEYYQENKEKIREKDKLYYEKNKDLVLEREKQRYRDNRDERLKHAKCYYQENKDNILKYQEQYRQENKSTILDYQKKYYWENRDILSERKKEYHKKTKHLRRQANQRRKARKLKTLSTLTIEQWEDIKNDFDNKCAYCGMSEDKHLSKWNEPLHQEHFIALSKGGEYTHNNIIPACRSCNSSKHDRDFFEWYSTYKHYSKARELFILKYLGNENGISQLRML